jgi:hypothetical protein
MSLQCADEHIVITYNGEEKYVKDLLTTDIIDTKEGHQQVFSVTKSDQKENMYDLSNVDGSIYYTNDITSHNTTVVSSYALWYACFNSDKTIGIVSNKQVSAIDIMSRIKRTYEDLPYWLKPGVVEFSKLFVTFDNGTKIMVSATSEDAFRGRTLNLMVCLGGENTVKVRDKISHEIKEIPIEELYNELEIS